MFYSSDLLSRTGKTPIARLWQVAHDMRVNKKVIEEFDIAGEPRRSGRGLPPPARARARARAAAAHSPVCGGSP